MMRNIQTYWTLNMQVLSASNKSQIGKITKKWGGILRELCTDADIYGIEFPLDLDVFMKALLLGACFLIDFMYYEKSYDDDDHRRRYR
ncbi:Phospholipid scramblase 1 [Blattella germanica]|nr:Phospholipid scramblase 1 [Blattella germanica]